MKNLYICSILLFVAGSITSLSAQRSGKPDYITSGYYQLVYEADIAHLEGNDSLAFEKLQEAEKRCPLINQFMYQEMNLYIQLLVRNGNFAKAIACADTLAGKYGSISGLRSITSAIEDDNLNNKDSVLYKKLFSEIPAFWDSVVPYIRQKSEAFYTPERKALIKELTGMCEKDQSVRFALPDEQQSVKTHDDSINIQKIREKIHYTDSINLIQMFDIIKKHGFPGKELIGENMSDINNLKLYTGIRAMLVHYSDSQKMQELLIKFVREGKCTPDTYGFFVDRKMLMERKKHIFAVFNNTKDHQIFDLENVDNRRLSIGLPACEMEQRRKELKKAQ